MGIKISPKKVNKIKILNYNFRKTKEGTIITNDFGNYLFLTNKEFEEIKTEKVKQDSPLYLRLQEAGFISDNLNFDKLFKEWQGRNSFVYSGPSLHIFVLTLRCNHKCLYCQSGALGTKAKNLDMSLKDAKKAVDLAFSTTNNKIIIEFQGGEPLLNWDVLKGIVIYAKEKQKKTNKELSLALVSNFSLMNEEKAKFLLENEVSICTSLDGPKYVHNKNRIYTEGDSHSLTLKWLKYFNERHDTQKGNNYRIFKPSALLTVAKGSLPYPKEIVDEYIKNKLDVIFLRGISPIGYAKKLWDKVGYTPKEFLNFYKTALEYILKLNEKGINIKEKTAIMLLSKILKAQDPGFLDLRCPCGATIGQIAYNYDGKIYTCDEGRMIGWEGDNFFQIGDVNKSKYKDLISNSQTKVCSISSNLENQPRCFRCAYKPWCGVCPAVNYESQKTPWGNIISNDRCAVFMGIFDILFELLRDKKKKAILEKWIN